MTVNKATVIENVYSEFYSLLKDVSGFDIYASFPNKDITSKSSYPIMILESPDISWENITFSGGLVEGHIELTIYTSDAKTADQYASAANNKIEISESVLYTAGLENPRVDSTDKEVTQRGKLNIHMKSLIWRFEFNFNRT